MLSQLNVFANFLRDLKTAMARPSSNRVANDVDCPAMMTLVDWAMKDSE
jgi:hypothetical protein